MRENARWNVNKTILKVYTVRNKIKHRKNYKIGKSPWVRFKFFSNSASLVRERLKSYPRVSDISLSCTPTGVRFFISRLFILWLLLYIKYLIYISFLCDFWFVVKWKTTHKHTVDNWRTVTNVLLNVKLARVKTSYENEY